MAWYFCKVLFILSVITANIVNGQYDLDEYDSKPSRRTTSTTTSSSTRRGQNRQYQYESSNSGFRIPQPIATALNPGFQIKIPDERGIILFAFHGAINREIRAGERGDFHGETRIKSNGYWTYETHAHQLQTGDVLNFWVYVQHDNLGYRLENQRYVYPDHFVYNTDYGSTNDYSSNYNTDNNAGINLSWNQEYTTQRSTTRRTTTQRTTTSTTPWSLVYESPNTYTQNQYQTTRSTRPTRSTTRMSTMSRGPATDGNYWPGTTQSTQNTHHSQYPQQNQYSSENQQNQYSPQNQPNQYSNQQNQFSTQNHNSQPNQYSQQNHNSNQNHNLNQNQNHNSNQNTQQNNHRPQQNNQNTQYQQQDCRPSITTVNKQPVDCKGTLLFDEQFDYNWQSRWSQDIRMPLEFEDAEFVVYQNYRSVWNVSSGNLNIFPKLLHRVPESGFSEIDIRSGYYIIDQRECTSFIDTKQECERQAGSKRILPPVVSAKFRSKKSFNFKYGRVEIRAKLPKGDWIFPQIFLEPTDNVYRGIGDLTYLNGQIRMAFIRGNEYLAKADGFELDGKILTGICVIAGADSVRDTARKSIQIGSEHFGNDFHTYSIIWTNTSVRFLVDGMEYGTDTGGYKQLKSIPNAIYWERGTNMAPFDQEFHVALGVGVGGNADFPDDSLNGYTKNFKPWENTSPKAELSFYLKSDEWYPTWNSRDSGLIVDYVKVYSV